METEQKKTEKKDWITLASVVACIAVVFLHTNGCFWTFSTARYWFYANIIESVFYFAVPVFFMITGATLMNYRKKYSLSVYLKKRFNKTVLPFLFWSMVAVPYGIILHRIEWEDLGFRFVWNGVFDTTFISIFWFFPVLFTIYLSIPVYAAVEPQNRKQVFSYAVIAVFILGGTIPLIFNSLLPGFSTGGINIAAASGYLMYPLLGYLISEYDIMKAKRMILYSLAVIGLLMHLIMTYRLSMEAGEIISTFKGYNNAPCILYSTGIFVWFRYNGNRIMQWRVVHKLATMVSSYTLCIYLLQYFIFTSMVAYFDINTLSIVYRLGEPFIVVPVAMMITWVIRKIPVLRRVVP